MKRLRSFSDRLVRREGAQRYLLITLLSFAASVALTRLFLELTGYPQLGGGAYHIAHVLWGGILLFFAALLPLVLANRWVYYLVAILGGVGVGLFIDEVGKFITSNNNYFHPLAAPIVYAFFLLTVLLYLRIRQPRSQNERAELYRALDALEEVLELDLDPTEHTELETRLKWIAAQASHPDFARLAKSLLEFLNSDDLQLASPRSHFAEPLLQKWAAFEVGWLTRGRARAILSGGLTALGTVGILSLAQAIPLSSRSSELEQLITRLVIEGQVSSSRGLNWFVANLALQASVGLLMVVGAILLLGGKDNLGASLAFLGLMLSLPTVNLFLFYFDQFSTIVTASTQFSLLLGFFYYRQRYL